MATKEQIAENAKTWIDTPFIHQGRTKGLGVDCIGLIVGVCKELGLKSQFTDETNGRPILLYEYDRPNYSPQPNPDQLKAELSKFCEPIDPATLGVGDIILFRMQRWPQHVGIVTDVTPEGVFFVHATEPVKKTILARYDVRWQKLTVGTFQFHASALEA